MRQAYLPRPGAPLGLRQIDPPRPGAREALVRITVATVCAQTDLGIIDGSHPPHDCAIVGMLPHDLRVHLNGRRNGDQLRRWYPSDVFSAAPPFPAPMGHEAAGTVVELGPEANVPDALVFPDEPLSVGDRVATFKVRGGYGEQTALATTNLVRIPPFMDDDEGSLLEPLIINYNCLRRCWDIRPARTVVVLGGGCQGLLALQGALALGAEPVIVTEPLEHRRELALELGAHAVVDPGAGPVVDAVLDLIGRAGADLVVECVGREETIRAAPYLVRRGGMLGQIGAYTKPVTFDYGYVHFRHFIVVPADCFISLRTKADQVRELLDLIEEGRIRLKPLISHRFPLGGINEAFDLVRDERDGVVKVAIDVSSNGHAARNGTPARRRATTGWGVLGAARVARDYFLPALEASDRARLVAVGSRRGERSYESVLSDPDVDAVYVSLPNSMHREWTLRALEAGKHVLCEKPLVLSLGEVDELEAAARAAGRHVMEAFRHRFQPLWRGTRFDELLEEVGTPRSVHAHASFKLAEPGDIRRVAALGGGATWDLGCYCLSTLAWRFGSPAAVEASSQDGGGVDWSTTASMHWDDGLAGTAWWSFDAFRHQRLTVAGERGTLDLFHPFWERPGPAGRLQTPAGVRELTLPRADCFRREIEHFGAVVRGELAPEVSLADSRAWLSLAERVAGSAS